MLTSIAMIIYGLCSYADIPTMIMDYVYMLFEVKGDELTYFYLLVYVKKLFRFSLTIYIFF